MILLLPNVMILLLMIWMNPMGCSEMQEYNTPSHGKLHKKRRHTRRFIKRLQFMIHIFQMESKFKKLILKSIKILRSMIHRRIRLLQIVKGIYLQTSGKNITKNNSFKRSLKLKSPTMSVAAYYRNIPP